MCAGVQALVPSFDAFSGALAESNIGSGVAELEPVSIWDAGATGEAVVY